MQHLKLYQKGKIVFLFFAVTAILTAACGRLASLMIVQSDYYGKKAQALHERERSIKAARGKIVDRNGIVLADNRSVCTVSVIHSQIRDPERVIAELAELLELPEDTVRKRVEKVSSIERISSNVPETGDAILARQLEGVKVDEDYRRYYPYDSLASKVIGFTGGDNQGIVGLEVRYDDWLSGEDGKILTMTNAYGQELEQEGERRQEPVTGNQLTISMDCNLQMYCEQAAQKVMLEKNADEVSVILMNPQNGEIFAMVNVPEYNLNEPFTLNVETASDLKESEKQDLLNQMWRNACINDTYEPGSTFKIITTAAALEQGVVTVNDSFYCPGYKIVEDRRIRCHKTTGHGAETFTEGIMNSCNPVFIELGLRLGAENFYHYFEQFGLLRKTGIDLPGEAATIMHKKENIGQVELATISFGQSFQITPIQLVTTVSSLINGGTRVVPHFGVSVQNAEGETRKTFSYDETEGTVSTATSKTLCDLLEHVVSEGTGKKAAIEGFSIGGKTATSQTLPRSDHKYIASFLGFAPAEDPQVIGLIVIDNPQGVYYGGTVAAPVMKEIFENALPYLGIGKTVTEQMQQEEIAAGSR